MKPTPETYDDLQSAYDKFNQSLFDGELPECLITLQREKNTCGYFSSARFTNSDGVKIDEIAINPSFFAVTPVVEVMQTLVHEMCHLWQFHFGQPGRGRYHNAQWADKMEAIGLMPSSTGKPGGKRTGDCIADYTIQGGRFFYACKELLEDGKIQLPWRDLYPPRDVVIAGIMSHSHSLSGLPASATSNIPAQYQTLENFNAATGAGSKASGETQANSSPNTAAPNKSNRTKYTCGCGHNIWAKPGLKARCEGCSELFEAIEP